MSAGFGSHVTLLEAGDVYKRQVYNSDTLGLGDLINTDKALSVIMAIFVSVSYTQLVSLPRPSPAGGGHYANQTGQR